MKKQLFTKGNGILALCAFVCLSLFYVACSKENATATSDSKGELPQLSEAEKLTMLKKEVESLGSTTYRHFKFFFTQRKAEEYINPLIRKEVIERVEKAKAEFKDLTAEQTIQKVELENRISAPAAKAMRELLTLGNSTDDIKTIEEFERRFTAFEEKVFEIKDLSDQEKVVIAGCSSTLRGITRFEVEMENGRNSLENLKGIQTRSASCPLGNRKTSCFTDALIKVGVAAVLGAIKTVVTGGALGVSAVVDFMFASFGAIANVFLNDSCKCSDSPGCFQADVINPIIDPGSPCNLSTNIGFALSGTGSDPHLYVWSAYRTPFGSSFEVPIASVQNKNTLIPLLDPFEVINQTDLIRVVVVTWCNGNPSPAQYTFRLGELLQDPGSVFISGPNQVSLNTTATFVMSGGCLANPNNNLSWNNPSAGYIVSGGNTKAVNIKFTTRTCYSYNGWTTSCFPVYITGSSTSPCQNSQGTYNQNANAWSVSVQ
jgi:hypothetical protein